MPVYEGHSPRGIIIVVIPSQKFYNIAQHIAAMKEKNSPGSVLRLDLSLLLLQDALV